MKPTVSAEVLLTLAALALSTARADSDNPLFASPSGNIACHMGSSG
ncbi:MAG TPA: hypothetical protein VLZ05_04375 [Mycobacterium sp.]|nr:hypothetical protein [Mycobacterium sp.]